MCCILTLVPRAIVQPHEVHSVTSAWPRDGLPENLVMGACRDFSAHWQQSHLDLLQAGLASRASLPDQSLSPPQDTQHTDRHPPTATLTVLAWAQESS